jgi:hypothetical protein
VTLDPTWMTPQALELAQSIYDGRSFERMSELADVLKQAACDNSDILNHCRRSGTHVRGCWVIDAILGKS